MLELATHPKEKSKKQSRFLQPIKSKPKRRDILVFDIESKKDDSQEAGFTRPFLVGFFDGKTYKEFRNTKESESIPWPIRHIFPGGCIDSFMRWLFAMDGCDVCNNAPIGRPVHCECVERREKFHRNKANIYSHNGGRFDELFVLGWLMLNQHMFEFELGSVQARIQRLEVWPKGVDKKEMCWVFYDSISMLPLSLSAATEALCPENLQKIKQNLDEEEHHPSWSTYLEMDCRSLFAALSKFHVLIEDDLKGEVGITAPSTAMKLFRRAFLKSWIERHQHFKDCEGDCEHGKGLTIRGLPKVCARLSCDSTCHGCAHEWIRRGYYGGRTELFKSYGRNVYYYDINSSYPASMLEDMPAGKMMEFGETHPAFLEKMGEKFVGFVECEVFIPKGCQIPPLPYRHGGKLIFPTGTLKGVWSWEELKLLKHGLVNGHIVKVTKSVWYQKRPLFREFVETLYAYREKHTKECKGKKCGLKHCRPGYDEGLAAICKLMLNSLYGKFGMREDRTAIVKVGPSDPIPANGWPIDGKHDGNFWEVERNADASYIIPQISAHITALSRIRLWYGMAEVVMKGGTLYYVDTDSIMASVMMTESEGLGGWKREEPNHLIEGEFILPKLYQLKAHKAGCLDTTCQGCSVIDKYHLPTCKNDKCKGCAMSVQKMKGVSGRVQTPENYNRMVHNGTDVVMERLQQHRGMLNSGSMSPGVITVRKSLRTEYDKRKLLEDGGTIPYHIIPKRKKNT